MVLPGTGTRKSSMILDPGGNTATAPAVVFFGAVMMYFFDWSILKLDSAPPSNSFKSFESVTAEDKVGTAAAESSAAVSRGAAAAAAAADGGAAAADGGAAVAGSGAGSVAAAEVGGVALASCGGVGPRVVAVNTDCGEVGEVDGKSTVGAAAVTAASASLPWPAAEALLLTASTDHAEGFLPWEGVGDRDGEGVGLSHRKDDDVTIGKAHECQHKSGIEKRQRSRRILFDNCTKEERDANVSVCMCLSLCVCLSLCLCVNLCVLGCRHAPRTLGSVRVQLVCQHCRWWLA